MHPTKGRVCDFVDIKVLVAKEGYAPSIAPSPFKRHGGLKILLLTKVKSFRQISENLEKSEKNKYICNVIKNISIII